MTEKKTIDSIVERAIERVLSDNKPLEQQKEEAAQATSRRRRRPSAPKPAAAVPTGVAQDTAALPAAKANPPMPTAAKAQNKPKPKPRENSAAPGGKGAQTSLNTLNKDKQRAINKKSTGGEKPKDENRQNLGTKEEKNGSPKQRHRQSSTSRTEQMKQHMRRQDELSSSHGFVSNPLASNPMSRRASLAAATDEGKPNVSAEKKLKIIPLGGMGEIGKNMTLIQYGEQILVVDAGVMFPDDAMLGIDLVIPDYSYLIEHRDNVLAFLLTHGHEDHIGAMPYILKDINAPVYSSRLTLGLLKGKLNEHRLEADLRQVSPRETVNIGPFKVEFFRITHSIPDSMGIAIHTPLGVIMLVSDFKMDMSPIDGQLMDFSRITALGEKGVLLLMADSTNVEREGYTDSERSVGYTFDKLFYSAEGRIILTSFASNVHRIQQALWAAEHSGRKVAIVGRGMQNV
ncbi:MAG: MBL fold metallo-hydrolase, partial [Clostridiales bacterium]